MAEGGTEQLRRRNVGGRDLPVAVAVGVVLVGLFLGSLVLGPLAFAAVIGVLATVSYLECRQVLHPVGWRLLPGVLIGATGTMLLGAYLAGGTGQAGGAALLVIACLLWLLVDATRTNIVRTLAINLLFGLWVGFLASYAVLIVMRPSGRLAVLAVVGAAIFGDIGGYAFGVAFGRHKVAPAVSPNKTWEGLVGGIAAATVVGAVVLPLFGDFFTAWNGGVLAATCAAAGFVGDLAESMVKRDLGVKDLGGVLPGHGGVLDRVDSILFALPVGHYALLLFV